MSTFAPGTRANVALAASLLLPTLLLARLTGNALWQRSALVTACAFVATERGKLGPSASLGQALAIQAGWIILSLALARGGWFVLACIVLSAIAGTLASGSERARAVASFTVVPSIYLAHQLPTGLAILDALPIVAAGGLPVWLWRLASRRTFETKPLLLAGGTTVDGLLVPLGVGLCAFAALELHVSHAHWLVWSSYVVACDDREATWRKFRDRSLGVVVGAPLGAGAASLLPWSRSLADLTLLLALLTLVSRERYLVFYTLRSALILLLAVHDGDRFAPIVRILEVIAGGSVAVASSWLSRALHARLAHRGR